MQEGNYIKINRKILDWEWYKNEHTKNVFLHCLLKANWRDGKFEGKVIPRGSFITSIKTISIELDLTEDEVRTALKHLLKTGELTKQTTNKYTVITVSNYESYQEVTKQIPNNYQTDTKQLPNNSHSIPNLFPTIEEYKEDKERNNINTMCKAEAFALFERLWKLYPVKKGKGNVSDAAKKRLFEIGYDEMERAIRRYTEYVESLDYLHYKNGSTFFNTGYIDYLDKNYEPPKKKSSSKPGFHQFKQNDYDFGALEKELTGK